MNACDDITLLNVLRIFRELLGVVTIVVPVILVIFVIIEVIKTISAGDVDTKKLFASISKRIVAAVVIFLLPFIIPLVLGLFGGDVSYKECWDNATKKNITDIATGKAIVAIEAARQTCVVNPNASQAEKEKAYEEARVAVKNIPFKEERDIYQRRLSQYKSKCK